MNRQNLNKYQQNHIITASSEQILLMLYDGAIRYTRQAIEGVENGDAALRRYGVSKTIAIIAEFSNTLDRKIGGNIAEDLDALYDYMIRELTSANLKNDGDKLKVVEDLLVGLRQTWGEAVEISRREGSPAPAEKKQESESSESPAQKASSGVYGVKSDGAVNYSPLSVSG